jgi:hypothetical protein
MTCNAVSCASHQGATCPHVVSETEVVLDPGDEIEDAGEAAAVPAGGASSAPSLPVWAFVLIIAGTLGMAVSGKRLAGSLLR